jgi:hypothetical protein
MGRYKTKGDHNHPEPEESTMPKMQDQGCKHEWRLTNCGFECHLCGESGLLMGPQQSTMSETKEATVTEKLSVTLSFEEWKGRFRDIDVSLLEDNGGEFVEITQGDETIHVPPQAIEDLCNAMVKVT